MKQPLISIFTPTYNRNQLLLDRALKSVLNQTYSNWEYIVVSDGPNYDLMMLLGEYQDDRIRFYEIERNPNRYPPSVENDWLAGPVMASNKALEVLKGDWICRLDDDDTWTKDHLEVLLQFAQEGNYDFVSAQYEAMKHNKKYLVGADLNGIGGIQTWLYKAKLKVFKYNIDCWRKRWNRVNDIDLSVQLYDSGAKMGFLEKVVAYVYPRPGKKTIGGEALE